jgi:hypothetical protein
MLILTEVLLRVYTRDAAIPIPVDDGLGNFNRDKGTI